MQRLFLALAGLFGASAVGLGAYGAHGLASYLAAHADDPARAQGWWETAVLYHLAHAAALGVAAWASSRGGLAPKIAGFAFVIGVLFFSGTLYAMALGAPRWLGAITPLGGLALIAAWIALAFAALRK
jgi:uncharacterized membrane protein YgdD (TMEM256/DUF423 family)